MQSSMAWVVGIVGALVGHAGAAFAEPSSRLLFTGRVRDVAWTDELLAVADDSGVALLRWDGTRVGVLAAPPRVPTSERAPRQNPDDVLDRFRIPIEERERESFVVERLLEDERSLRETRALRQRADEPPVGMPRVAAARGEDGKVRILASVGGRLMSVADDATVTLRRLWGDGEIIRLVSSGGPALLVVGGLQLALSRDGGSLFAPLLGSRRGPWTVSPDGDVVASADGSAVTVEREGARTSVPLPGHVVELAHCRGHVVALLADALVAIDGARARVLATGLAGGRRLACDARSARVVVVGDVLWVSGEDDLTFTPKPEVAADAAAVVLTTPWGVLVGSDAGLVLYAFAAESAPFDDTVSGPTLPPRTVPAPRSWASRYLPQLVVEATWVDRGPRGHDARAMAIAEVGAGVQSTRPARRVALDDGRPVVPRGAGEVPGCLADLHRAATNANLLEPGRARSLVTRAGRAAFLPELRLRVERRVGRSESLDVPAAPVTASPVGLDTVDDVRYEARATWDLARLVFDPDELAAQAQALRMSDMRRELLAATNRLFFERRRLERDVASAPDEEAALRRRLRLGEVEADLDALTDGASRTCR